MSTCDSSNSLRMVFWETTTACNLKCRHCRACVVNNKLPDELDTKSAISLIKSISNFSDATLVFSGGEPLLRKDLFQLVDIGKNLGLRIALATNGTLVNKSNAEQLLSGGIQRVSVSIDGNSSEIHDSLRCVPGSFDMAIKGIKILIESGIPTQINTTVTKDNYEYLQDILQLAIDIGACGLHLFLLVPTGCGRELDKGEIIGPDEYEKVLDWVCNISHDYDIDIRATCAPHYSRVLMQKNRNNPTKVAGGCLAGKSVCFVSYRGDVYPCGYFPVSAGNIIEKDISEIWKNSALFNELRHASSRLTGKCGFCEFKNICGGCRARAYAETGNYLDEEPFCVYLPRKEIK